MSDYFALSQIFMERYTWYGVKWAVELEAGGTVVPGFVAGEGSHFMIPRQEQVELKWVFDTVEIENRADQEISLEPNPVAAKVCFDDYGRWASTFQSLGKEAWLNQWMIEAADRLREEVGINLRNHPELTRHFINLADVRLVGTPLYVALE